MPIVLSEIQKNPSFSERLGSSLGGGIQRGVAAGTDFATELMKAKYQNELQRGLLFNGANARLNLRDNGSGQGLKSEVTISPGNALRGNVGAPSQNVNPQTSIVQPTQLSPTQTQNNRPTGSSRSKLRNDQEIQDESYRRAAQLQSQGIPSNPEEEAAIIRQEEQDKINYRNLQSSYGDRGRQAITKVFPNATDEHQSIFARKAEQYMDQNMTDAEIDRNLAVDAKNFTNTLSRAEKVIPPRDRLSTKIKDKFLGTGRDSEKARESVKQTVEPLLREGLYDTSRQLLSNAGYYPEEIESIVSELGEGSVKALSTIPKVKKEGFNLSGISKKHYSPDQLEQVNEVMKQAFQSEPSVNLLLLRKGFEDKGVDWRAFKDSFDDLLQSGEIQLNEDQTSFLNKIDEPPLNNLEKILHGMGLRGR